MKAQELRKLDDPELKKKLADLIKQQRDLRFNKARGELKNPLLKRIVKRDIARILTIMKEKQA